MNLFELRKKYPKWAHQRRYRKRVARRKRKRSYRKRPQKAAASSTDTMLLTLLHQIMGARLGPVARKHGENVLTGYADGVTPDRLAPLRSRDYYTKQRPRDDRNLDFSFSVRARAGEEPQRGPRGPMPT